MLDTNSGDARGSRRRTTEWTFCESSTWLIPITPTTRAMATTPRSARRRSRGRCQADTPSNTTTTRHNSSTNHVMMVEKLVIISCITVLLNVSRSVLSRADPVYQKRIYAFHDHNHYPGTRLASVSPRSPRRPVTFPKVSIEEKCMSVG